MLHRLFLSSRSTIVHVVCVPSGYGGVQAVAFLDKCDIDRIAFATFKIESLGEHEVMSVHIHIYQIGLRYLLPTWHVRQA